MTRLYFVRHAETDYSERSESFRQLSPKGEAACPCVTKFLADKHIDAVISSPYIRAVDTLRDFADAYNFRIKIISDLRERRVGREWLTDFEAFCRRQWEDFDFSLEGGESLAAVQRRNISAMRKILSEYRGKHVVVGTHGTSLCTIMNYYMPEFGYADFARIRPLMPHIVRMDFEGQQFLNAQEYDIFSEIPAMKG